MLRSFLSYKSPEHFQLPMYRKMVDCVLWATLDSETERKYWVLTKLRLLKDLWRLLATNIFGDIFTILAPWYDIIIILINMLLYIILI